MLKKEGMSLSFPSVCRSAESPVCWSRFILRRDHVPMMWSSVSKVESGVCSGTRIFCQFVFMARRSLRETSFLGQITEAPGPSLQAFSGRHSDTTSCQDVRPTVTRVWVLESGRGHAMGSPWSPKREQLSDFGSGTAGRHWKMKLELSAPASGEARCSTGGPVSALLTHRGAS